MAATGANAGKSRRRRLLQSKPSLTNLAVRLPRCQLSCCRLRIFLRQARSNPKTVQTKTRADTPSCANPGIFILDIVCCYCVFGVQWKHAPGITFFRLWLFRSFGSPHAVSRHRKCVNRFRKSTARGRSVTSISRKLDTEIPNCSGSLCVFRSLCRAEEADVN